jgi:hypothetical protein
MSLPSAFYQALGKAFTEYPTLGKAWNEKKPKNNTNFFFRGRQPLYGARPCSSKSQVAVFFVQNSRLTRPVGFELATSLSREASPTTTLHTHMRSYSLLLL